MDTLKKEKGFSLVELAIVFVVMGVLLAVGIKMLAPMLGRAKLNETDKIVQAAVDSIVGHVAIEHEFPDDFKTVVTTSEDIWGNDLIFRAANMNPIDICNQSTTDMSATNCFNPDCSNNVIIPNVALVVFSKGEDLNKQTDEADVKVYPKGTVIGTPPNTEIYDDVVKWVSLNELRVRAGCSGAPLKILNNELPLCGQNISGDSTYKATIYADGGVGSYKWCRQESSSTGLLFTPNFSSSDCTSEPVDNWMEANSLTIDATPVIVQGSFNITFFVRDDEGNVASKSLVTTLDPKCSPTVIIAETAENLEEAEGTPDVYVCHQTCTTSCETVAHTCPSDNSNSNGNGNMNGNSSGWDSNSNSNSNANGNGNENGNSNLNANDNGAWGYDGCVEWTEEVCAAPVCTSGDLQIDVADLAEHMGHGDTLGACDSGIVDIDGDSDNDNYSDKDEYDCGSDKDNSNSAPPDSDKDGWCDGKDAYDNDNSRH
ncbi:MAG: prepilin-type N-terminal cleavage/methylation domain-containing protein [Nitrospirae bacterium]|nr:prepilin-type N-terminal cleavage/methylation domain-containing protein [Nitrospirota bacterium]